MFSLAIKRFLKYSSIGISTFLLDLLLLGFLIEFLKVNYLLASGTSFLIAVSVNYVLSVRYVFRGSQRNAGSGYVNFLLIAGAGALLVVGGMYVLVEWFAMTYLTARIVVATLTGLWNYLMNLYVNFKVAGSH